jgi:hypothetical protein
MPLSGKLLAWVEPQSDDEFLAAFVGAPAASTRRPATQVCSSPDEARQWVERQATALGIPVEWVNAAPQRQW